MKTVALNSNAKMSDVMRRFHASVGSKIIKATYTRPIAPKKVPVDLEMRGPKVPPPKATPGHWNILYMGAEPDLFGLTL